MGLLHLQQNIEIPDVSLPAHPRVQAAIKKAADEGLFGGGGGRGALRCSASPLSACLF